MTSQSGPRMTIDELARAAGTTVRTVRNYQTKGLIPGPTLAGRTGLYEAEHLARLQLIKDMQGAGFNLTAIKRLLAQVPEGAGEEALRFGQALFSPWTDEKPEIVSAEELAKRFGDPGPEVLERAERAGVLRPTGDGRFEISIPSLMRAGEQVMALGVPLDQALDVVESLVANSNRVAGTFVELFLENVWRPFEAEGRPSEKWPEVRAALERLRPLAAEALLATFRARMATAVEGAFGSALESAEEEREVG